MRYELNGSPSIRYTEIMFILLHYIVIVRYLKYIRI